MGTTKAFKVIAGIIILALFICLFYGIIDLIYYQQLTGDPPIGVHISKYTNWDDEDICQYGDCEKAAEKEVFCKIYDNERAMNKLLSIPNEANLSLTSDSFSYTPKKTYYKSSTGTYLTPQKDGSYKIEERDEGYFYEKAGNTHSYSYVEVEGKYCSNHAELAARTLRAEILSEFITKNAFFWLGFIVLPLFVIALIVLSKKRKAKQTNEVNT